MSSVNFLEKLLDGVGVEWKSVSEIFDIKNGYTPSKSIDEYWADGSINWFRMDDIREKGNILQESIQKISSSAVKSGKLFPENSIIISTSATIGEHALIQVPHLANQRFTSLSIKSKYKNIFDIKFIFYYCYLLAEWCKKNTTVSSFASVDMDGFRRFSFPVLCPDNPKKSLEIQAEIVRILDAMTAHTAELTAELTARKKQYDYYRDKLLSFEEGAVEWMTLGDMAFICDGTHQTPTYTQEGVPFVSVENIKNISASKKRISFEDFEKYKYKPQKNDVLMTRIGDIGSCAIVNNDKPLAYYVTLALIRIDQEIMLPRYLKYVIESNIGVRELRKRTLVNASPIKINLGEIGKIILPVPSIKEQTRIVEILDKFDALTTSITEGLPREIELRQKQYAYYRDLLLSFPAAQAA